MTAPLRDLWTDPRDRGPSWRCPLLACAAIGVAVWVVGWLR